MPLCISIHPPRVGRDPLAEISRNTWMTDFNPPSPCGEGLFHTFHVMVIQDFNPPSPCGEGLAQTAHRVFQLVISIHPPRVGRDLGDENNITQNRKFQSTLPVWGGTLRKSAPPTSHGLFQSTLPVWGGTDNSDRYSLYNPISIHPPRVGRDLVKNCRDFISHLFQSTLPVWGGTWVVLYHHLVFMISIHPPRVGRDGEPASWNVWDMWISIHPPRVGRDLQDHGPGGRVAQISIHPPRVGRDVDRLDVGDQPRLISIHPPRVGRDPQTASRSGRRVPISIHPPRVGRDFIRLISVSANARFQSTLPVWGGTVVFYGYLILPQNFNPPSPCGEGPSRCIIKTVKRDFNPPSPCGEGRVSRSRVPRM